MNIGMVDVNVLPFEVEVADRWSQWNAARTRPPHLKTIVAYDGATDMYRDRMYHGGIPIQGFLSTWLFGSVLYQHELGGIDIPFFSIGVWGKAGLHGSLTETEPARDEDSTSWSYPAPQWRAVLEISNNDSLIADAPMTHFYGQKVGTDTCHHDRTHPSTLRRHERPHETGENT